MKPHLTVIAVATICACAIRVDGADNKPPRLAAAVFSDHMVLQRGIKIPVWGEADDTDVVKVTLNGQTVSATIKDGRWRVDLPAMEAGGPYTLTVEGKTKVEFKDVMIGDVWVCSGQSNMAFGAGGTEGWNDVKGELPVNGIRLFVPTEPDKSWRIAGGQVVEAFPGVGYYFGRMIHQTQKIPIGLINSSQGCTGVRMWISADREKETGYSIAKTGLGTMHSKWIKPIQPYGIKGAIWYQGESDGRECPYYEEAFKTLIENWRAEWGVGDFPFLFVQMPCYPGGLLTEAFRHTMQNVPNTGMATVFDTIRPEEFAGHPRQKKPTGERLALIARAKVYGENVECYGPLIESASREGDHIVLTFSHADGLKAKGGEPKMFEVLSPGRNIPNARATIEGNKVILKAPDLARSATVRYACTEKWFQANLYNSAELPASPFILTDVRTDPVWCAKQGLKLVVACGQVDWPAKEKAFDSEKVYTAEGFGFKRPADAATIIDPQGRKPHWWQHPVAIKIDITCPPKTSGTVCLFIVDADKAGGGRKEAITVAGREVGVFENFDKGQWVEIPFTTDDGKLNVTVSNLNPKAQAVLSRLEVLAK